MQIDQVEKLLKNRAKEVTYEEPSPQEKYAPIGFSHAAEMLAVINSNIRDEKISLHRWQAEDLIFISNPDFQKDDPLFYSIQAANGSGKDAYVIAPIALFKLICCTRSRTIITSSSYAQLKLQTEAYIKNLAEQTNEYLISNGIWTQPIKINKQHFVAPETGSEVILFTTDEGGRAEGYHPFPDYPDGKVTIILNEAKSIPDIIFEHLSRCTYTLWIEVSSPGRTSGKFYQNCTKGIYGIKNFVRGKRVIRKVTSYDCPHISPKKIAADALEWGESSPLFKSKHLAEFSSVDESVVITQEVLDKCLAEKEIPKFILGHGRHAGLDLAKGGDENTLYVFDENIFVGSEKFRMGDTTETITILRELFKKYSLEGDKIYADDGHVGGAIIDALHKGDKERGIPEYPIRRVCNQSKPRNPRMFSNRGAEMWFSFARLVQEKVVSLPKDDPRLQSQLVNRYYDQSDAGKFKLESKEEARECGHGSPDRADAVVLAFCGISIMEFMEKNPERFTKGGIITQQALISRMESRNVSGLPSYMARQLRSVRQNGGRHSIGSILRNIYSGKN